MTRIERRPASRRRGTGWGAPFAALAVLAGLCSTRPASAADSAEDGVIRVGVIGTDTSHAVAFTKLMNAPDARGALAKVRVVAAYPGGSDDIASSRDRVDQYASQLRDMGVAVVDSIEEVVSQSDVLLLESVDGRVHLGQFRKIAVGKPVFVDKPAAASYEQVEAIFALAKQTNTPCFSSSALRFAEQVESLKQNKAVGGVVSATVSTPYQTEPHHPDLYWYGIHGVEALYSLLGPGCARVRVVETDKVLYITGEWSDGRIGAVNAVKTSKAVYSFALVGDKGAAVSRGFAGYDPLVHQIAEFFATGIPAVDNAETLELFAFMDAAHASKQRGGEWVALAGREGGTD